MINPVDRLASRLPQPWRTIVDWVVTVAGAVAIVLFVKAAIVNPYRIPSSSMEPTLHCEAPIGGCLAENFSDRVLANRLVYRFKEPERGDVIVFDVPDRAEERCGAGGVFVKRVIALPGERWRMENGFVYVDGKRLVEPYVEPSRRGTDTRPETLVADGEFVMLGDNRTQS